MPNLFVNVISQLLRVGIFEKALNEVESSASTFFIRVVDHLHVHPTFDGAYLAPEWTRLYLSVV